MKLASNSDISATAFMIDRQPVRKCIAHNNDHASWGSERKTYIPLYIGQIRVVVCVDQGSDVNLIQRNLFTKLFPLRLYEIKNNDQGNVKTFSNHPVKILGSFSCQIRVQKGGPPYITIIHIIEDLKQGIPNFLFGNKGISDGWSILAFTGCKEDPQPEFIVKNPIEQHVPVLYVAPRDLNIVEAEYIIGPYETIRATFYLHQAAQVLSKDIILITPNIFEDIHVLASRSELHWDSELKTYYAYGALMNLKRNHRRGRIQATMETLPAHTAVAIQPGTVQQVQRLVQKFPIVQEILPSASNFETELHTIQVHQVNLNVDPIECEDGEKLNPEEILSIKKESYTGTAEINSSSLDAGMEVPTLIHNSPEEALNLNQFEAHLRPFLKNIFLEKYPNTVALHSLDAGNISKTLGYTALRLIPGETLPRH